MESLLSGIEMPQYAVIGTHPPDNCPLTNKAVREFAMKSSQKFPDLARRLGVKVLSELHLDPDHKAFMLFEASNAEAVRDYLLLGGYTHYLNMNLHLVTPIADLLKRADEFPTVY
jgi:hypothetical protein